MAKDLIIEVETGVYRGIIVHPHNGYYAGESVPAPAERTLPTRPGRTTRIDWP